MSYHSICILPVSSHHKLQLLDRPTSHSMAPSALPLDSHSSTHASADLKASKREPIRPTGALDHYQHTEVTTVIGREYETANIVDDLLNAPNADELLRELAYTSASSACVAPITCSLTPM